MMRVISPRPAIGRDARAASRDAAGGSLPGLPSVPETELDARTLAYVQQAQPVFDLFRQAEGQLAGLMVLAAAGSRSALPDHPILASARAAFEDGLDRLRRTVPSQRGRHHHHHLSEAGDLIGRALAQAERALRDRGDAKAEIGAALKPLQQGHRHLQWATTALPGFEMVAFEQGCCAVHARPQRNRADAQ
jgi:hypothetical protein